MAGFIGRSIVSTVEISHITYSYCSVGYIQGNRKKFSDLINVSFLIFHLKKSTVWHVLGIWFNCIAFFFSCYVHFPVDYLITCF